MLLTLTYGLSTLSTIVSAATIRSELVSDVAHTKRDDNCSTGPFVGQLLIGGTGPGKSGNHFCEVRTGPGLPTDIVSKLDIWWTEGYGIRGIQLTYSNGMTAMQGKQTETTKGIQMANDERVESLAVWGNDDGSRVGYISLRTSKGQLLEGGKDKDPHEYDINVGSGILLGMVGAWGTGKPGTDITSIAFLFLRSKVEAISVSKMKFKKDPSGTTDGITGMSMVDETVGNKKGSKGDMTVSASISQTTQKTTTYEQQTQKTFSTTAELSLEVAEIGLGASISTEWSTTNTKTTSWSNSEQVTLTHAMTKTLKPGEGTHCKISAKKGSNDFPYTSDVKLSMEDGSEYSYSEEGVLKAVMFSSAFGSCDPENDASKWQADQDSPPPDHIKMTSTSDKGANAAKESASPK